MSDLDFDDIRHIRAAEGWLGLGDHVEADRELDELPALKRAHPKVLEVRYLIYEKVKRWSACVDIAQAIVKKAPSSSFGWIKRSEALHNLKKAREALEYLMPAADHFPNKIEVFYNLACYHCVLGEISQATLRVATAFNLITEQHCLNKWRLRMLDDPDFEPFWGMWDEPEAAG